LIITAPKVRRRTAATKVLGGSQEHERGRRTRSAGGGSRRGRRSRCRHRVPGRRHGHVQRGRDLIARGRQQVSLRGDLRDRRLGGRVPVAVRGGVERQLGGAELNDNGRVLEALNMHGDDLADSNGYAVRIVAPLSVVNHSLVSAAEPEDEAAGDSSRHRRAQFRYHGCGAGAARGRRRDTRGCEPSAAGHRVGDFRRPKSGDRKAMLVLVMLTLALGAVVLASARPRSRGRRRRTSSSLVRWHGPEACGAITNERQ